ncbi:DUF4430 domain-containing protein [Allofustis seminis]|uniref:DUF4430 domain-containing protein n=1 Tax=Allofustis seminis TaxID=166939 RepID=UPI000371B8B1|nr:DUF4430 domain-containing protein [Allofustis seminis]
MKNSKWKELGFASFVVLALVACGTDIKNNATQNKEAPATADVQKEELKATFEIKNGDDTLADKEVTFKEGATVFEVLDANFEVKAEDTDYGKYIKAIDGVEEDTSASKFWLYTVNDKMAEVDAGEMTLKDGDKVTWTLSAM